MADMASDPRRAADLLEAVAEYRRLTKQGVDLTRQCPDCDGPMRKGRRYCPTCADRRRKATFRESQGRTRQTAGQVSTVVAENTPDSLGN